MSAGIEAGRAATRAVRAGIDRDEAFGAVTPPLVLSSNFSFAGFDAKRRYDYTRSGNPTRDLLGEALAELEGGAGGTVTATGMAAITLVLHALLEPGDRLLVPHDGYGGSWRLFKALAAKGLFELELADLTDPRALAAALVRGPKLVWIETPSNPLLRITDLRFVIDAAHQAGALAVVDNTFLSPALYRPLEDGADVVVHSATKYLSGHGNLLGGVIAARNGTVHAMRNRIEQLGGVMSPQNAWQLLNGIKTLPLRMRQHSSNAMAVAEVLASHDAVKTVNYPGLPNHPGHELARELTGGRFSGMVSLRLVDHERSRNVFLNALEIPYKAVSLGDTVSLVWPFDEDGVIRLSLGIEDTEDLVADVRQALDAVTAQLGASAVATG